MSDADLVHAKLDQADLSAANFNNARLDYADFAGAKLSKANLCGACLRHAKNLTQSQLEESTGSVSTILPPHLQGSVPWSPVIGPTIERYELRALPRVNSGANEAHFTPGNRQRLDLCDPQHRGAAAVVTTSALVITALIWQCATMLNGQWRSEQSTTESSLPYQALTKTKSAFQYPAHLDAVAKTIDQASLAEKQSAEEPDPNAFKKANVESNPLVLVPTPPAAWPHAIVPTLSSKALASSDLAHEGSPRQEAVSFGAETPPNSPARDPTRGQDIETAAIPSNVAMPPIPIRNPRR